jgi:hypothetical protein
MLVRSTAPRKVGDFPSQEVLLEYHKIILCRLRLEILLGGIRKAKHLPVQKLCIQTNL